MQEVQNNHSSIRQEQQSNSSLRDLDYLFEKLIAKYAPLKIFCFHRHTEFKSEMGCFKILKEVSVRNYWLLMVTADSSRIEHAVQDFTNAHYNQGTVTILVHGQEGIGNAIIKGNRFFMTVYNTGQLVYAKEGLFRSPQKNYESSVPDPEPEDRFKEGISRAEGFFHGAKECFATQKYSVCAFMLHQAVEQCCIALISLHMDYRCDIHNLRRLLALSRCFSEAPYRIFFTDAENDEHLFELLTKSYVNSRYSKDFFISTDDLTELMKRVQRLLDCKLRLDSESAI